MSVGGRGKEGERERQTDRQRKDHNIPNFDFRNIRLPLHLWEPNYCISMGMPVYCLAEYKGPKVN